MNFISTARYIDCNPELFSDSWIWAHKILSASVFKSIRNDQSHILGGHSHCILFIAFLLAKDKRRSKESGIASLLEMCSGVAVGAVFGVMLKSLVTYPWPLTRQSMPYIAGAIDTGYSEEFSFTWHGSVSLELSIGVR